jgi:hypothetical protein
MNVSAHLHNFSPLPQQNFSTVPSRDGFSSSPFNKTKYIYIYSRYDYYSFELMRQCTHKL